MTLNWLSLHEASRQIHDREITPLELMEACLAQVEADNDRLNTYLTVLAGEAIAQATYATQALSRGEDWGALHGIPIAIKDLIDVEGVETTAASPFLKGNVAQDDAPVVTNLKAEGAIIIGKTHLHEYAIGATNLNPHFGPAHNPWQADHITGGSSGGSAAAVAGGMALGALGTDTGGSVRIPSALCNLTGLRPGRGQVSTQGVIPLSWTLDTVGPMAHSVRDIALLMDALNPAIQHGGRFGMSPAGLAFGFPENAPFWLDVSTEVVMLIRGAVETLVDIGLKQVDISLPALDEVYRAAGIISISEGAAYHQQRLQQQPDVFGSDVRQRLVNAQQHTGVQYALARQRGREWRAYLEQMFKRIDVIVLPITPYPAPRIVDTTPRTSRDLLRFNYPFSLSSLPCLALPCGFTDEGLPVGVQLVSPAVDLLLHIGDMYQHHTDWHARRPIDI